MRSILLYVISAFNNVYSGWIWWNLFLAFIPLWLSFALFRPGVMPRWLLWGAWGLTGAIGAVGIAPRLPRVLQGWFNLVGDGGAATALRLLWLLLVTGAATVLGLLLLRKNQVTQGWLWWVGVAVFLAFLPNAPYMLTDIIHLIRGVSYGQTAVWVVALVFIPVHSLAILLGFQAYVISILNLAIYLKRQGARALILPVELTIHALCAVGIYLGRFLRFNSWDLVVDPTSVVANTLNLLTSRRPAAVIVVTFVILTSLYWILKQINLGLKLRLRYLRQGLDALD